VVPDVILPDPLAHLKSGEQYNEYSLPWDTVQPTDYASWTLPVSDLDRIRANSNRRTRTNAEFVNISQDSRAARERSERTLQSLFIDDVRKEREESKLMEKRAGASPHGMTATENNPAPGEAIDPDQWVKTLKEDPYAQEAISILNDLVAVDASIHAAGKPRTVKTTP
jgi:carboxyl-terminal processing protease